MLNEMVKSAGCSLAERVKVAAAIVVMHNYDRTQDIMGTAGYIKTAAAQQGIDMPDATAINAAEVTLIESDMAKVAAKIDMAKVKSFLGKPGVRIPGLALAGGGVAAGGAALAGEDDPKALALAGLLGGGAGAFMGAKPEELAKLRELIKSKALGV